MNTGAAGHFYPNEPHWEGRMAVTIHSEPVQRTSAQFELRGSAPTGSLTLTSPLGTTLAQLQWDAHGATLDAQDTPKHFATLAELTRQLTGTELPIESLFSWLQGQPATPGGGWEVDLPDLGSQRLRARRLSPLPQVELTILLDTPTDPG